jgi:hypothetical protein
MGQLFKLDGLRQAVISALAFNLGPQELMSGSSTSSPKPRAHKRGMAEDFKGRALESWIPFDSEVGN